MRRGLIGNLEYEILDVRGDGNCFYRALFQLLKDLPEEDKENLTIQDTESEEDGVEQLRMFVADSLRKGYIPEGREAIDTLFSLLESADPEYRPILLEQLHEGYPFVTEEVYRKRGIPRYKAIADLIEDMDDPMYASSLEHDMVKLILISCDVTLCTLDLDTRNRKSPNTQNQKWKKDLLSCLKTASTSRVIVLLNKDNIHYQYFRFKTPENPHMNTLMDRVELMYTIELSDTLPESLHKLIIHGGGKKKQTKRRNKPRT